MTGDKIAIEGWFGFVWCKIWSFIKTSIMIVIIVAISIFLVYVLVQADREDRMMRQEILNQQMTEAKEDGMEEIRYEAVREGLAYWVADSNGVPLFVWGVKEN